MSEIRILLADDDLTFCKLAGNVLLAEGYLLDTASSPSEARAKLAESTYHIILLDLCFPELEDGFAMLEEIHDNYPETVVLMISGSGHIPDAVTAIKMGAFDFVEKPISSEHLRVRIKSIAGYAASRQATNEMAKTAIGMIGNSPAMQSVYSAIIRAAQFDSPVLITGETGVGKELTAQAIHRLSRYRDKTMVCINCASIPKELFESELFGYEAGAFTGAHKARKGYFEHAHNNSFFMDEIGEIPPSAQAKLLRVISEGEIQKVGGRIQKVNTRLIAASNRDLNKEQSEGRFRSDLFYRLNSIHIHIPALRERKEDIILLANYFATEFCNANNKPPMSISFDAMQWLYSQEWKGNIRELRSCIERGVIFATTEHLTVADLQDEHPDASYTPEAQTNLRQAIVRFERSFLQHCLNTHKGNVTQTANALGIDKSNLFKKIGKYNLVLRKEKETD